MRFALDGTEKWVIWKSATARWCVAAGHHGCPFGFARFFATWRQAMDWADRQ